MWCEPPTIGPIRRVGAEFTGDTHYQFSGDNCLEVMRDSDFAPAYELGETVDPGTFAAVPLTVDD